MTNDNQVPGIETAATVHGAPRRVKLYGHAAARMAFNVDDDHRAEIGKTPRDWLAWFRGVFTDNQGPPPADNTEVELR